MNKWLISKLLSLCERLGWQPDRIKQCSHSPFCIVENLTVDNDNGKLKWKSTGRDNLISVDYAAYYRIGNTWYIHGTSPEYPDKIILIIIDPQTWRGRAMIADGCCTRLPLPTIKTAKIFEPLDFWKHP